MTEQLSDKEKALLILEKAKNAFNECSKQLRETQTAFMELTSAVKTASDNLKRVLNEEENNGNIHKECKYYNSEKDDEKNCGLCKHYNLDGMFGVWCDIHEIPTSDEYCSDFERNRR